jgi:hypothetical protein
MDNYILKREEGRKKERQDRTKERKKARNIKNKQKSVPK